MIWIQISKIITKILSCVILVNSIILFSSDVFASSKVVNAIRSFLIPDKQAWVRENSDEILERFFRDNPVDERTPFLLEEDLWIAGRGVVDEIAEVLVVAHNPGVLDIKNIATRRQTVERFKDEFSDREILEGLKGVFKGMDKSSEFYIRVKRTLFENWWSDDFVRPFMFDFIGKEDLSSPDYLLKWWDEAKARGGEMRLQEYTRDFMGNLRSGRFDPFGMVLMKTVRENEAFAKEWEHIMETPTPRSGIEHDWDDLA